MAAIKTARDRARAELTQEIKDEARRQLGEVGAHGLSLRAVARELGMVSSALYRYFPSRDHLLTALIIDAYNAIGEAVEKADDTGEDPRSRWQLLWQAARNWALAHPHEYALIYGSPIPGYQAPQDTVGPAARVALALVGVATSGVLRPAFTGPPVPEKLQEQARGLVETIEAELSPADMSRLLIAWTQLFGAINFELFGQYVGSADPADAFFMYTCFQMADFVGLR
ncbi:TetR/AcrR family transcriptional regulator [Amycolatopsis acidiphila]|uniref:TetR/AcrR family transcriptional regulator n=1 Tax=Amycolatopsis acidiphila TaxID=715473 RepID=A0A558AN43_9PSEU|nr:TetR/AcrR family transcriptional regulator [Amycolatopsis acidiphila]TVT25689.1 TetR/AcrR family transcriptional regulator [Amycolatopsis acidiphila]UIJ60446.1 TetR/AcrR family transcriptional regulator [Amycolatopsis acidiphila]GHG82849.1 TetR family transcriptional regulator [Amycolatopsis acidiphila]